MNYKFAYSKLGLLSFFMTLYDLFEGFIQKN